MEHSGSEDSFVVVRRGGFQTITLVQRHFWRRSILGLTAADSGVDERHSLCQLLEEATVTDQLNIGELETSEDVARRLQLWEEAYGARLRQAEAGDGGVGWLEERSLFLGRGLVCSALESWVSDRLAAESAILKQRRKGREERALARGLGAPSEAGEKERPKGGRGGGGSGGGRK